MWKYGLRAVPGARAAPGDCGVESYTVPSLRVACRSVTLPEGFLPTVLPAHPKEVSCLCRSGEGFEGRLSGGGQWLWSLGATSSLPRACCPDCICVARLAGLPQASPGCLVRCLGTFEFHL